MEQDPVRFLGFDVALKGEKGRFVLPSAFRKNVLAASAQDRTMYVAPNSEWKCLDAFGKATINALEDTVAKEVERQTRLNVDFNVQKYEMKISRIIPVPFDPSGRLVLPDYLTGPCKIDQELLIHGGVSKFTLWSPEVFFAMDDPDFEPAKPIFRHLLAQAHAAKKK